MESVAYDPGAVTGQNEVSVLQAMLEKLQVLSAHEARIESLVVRLLSVTDGHEIHHLAREIETLHTKLDGVSRSVDELHSTTVSASHSPPTKHVSPRPSETPPQSARTRREEKKQTRRLSPQNIRPPETPRLRPRGTGMLGGKALGPQHSGLTPSITLGASFDRKDSAAASLQSASLYTASHATPVFSSQMQEFHGQVSGGQDAEESQRLVQELKASPSGFLEVGSQQMEVIRPKPARQESQGSVPGFISQHSSEITTREVNPEWPKELVLRKQHEEPDLHFARRPSFGTARRKSNSFLNGGEVKFQRMASQQEEALIEVMGSEGNDDGEWALFCKRRCRRPINPTSHGYVLFQCVSICVLLWDLFTIPFLLAWYEVVSDFTSLCGYVSASFWSVDIITSFFVGYYKEGEAVMSYRKIMKNYMRGWFFADLLIVMSDWTALVLGNTSSFKLVRLFKIVRLLRILVIFRLARLWRVMKEKLDHNLSENSRLLIRILCLCSMVLVLNHIVACVWFGLGRHGSSDTHGRWTDIVWILDGEELGYMESGIAYQYTTALHWAVAQITMGANEINATNTNERIMQVVCLILGLICGSTFISSLSAAVFEYNAVHEEQKKSMRVLRRFLQQHDVDWRTSLAVQRQVAERAPKSSQVIPEEEVQALTLLTPIMRLELTFVIQKDHAMKSDILKLWTVIDVRTAWQLCGHGTKVVALERGDELFDVDQLAETVFLVTKGTVLYTQEMENQADIEELVPTGSWIAEAALWVEWVYMGACDAQNRSTEVFEISIYEFLKVMSGHPLINKITADYGRQFHRCLTRAIPPLHSSPTDLKHPGCDPVSLVLAMTRESRVHLSQAVLEKATSGLGFVWGEVKDLKYDVASGNSVFMLTEAEEVVRIVSSVTLKVHLDARTLLFELGRCIGGQVQVTGRLPELHQEIGEITEDTLERMLSEDMHTFRPLMKFEGSYREPLETDGKVYGFPNVTGKTVIICHTEEDLSTITSGAPLQPQLPHGSSKRSSTSQNKQYGGSSRSGVCGLEEATVYTVTSSANRSKLIFYTGLTMDWVERLSHKNTQEGLLELLQQHYEYLIKKVPRLAQHNNGSFDAIKESYSECESVGSRGSSMRANTSSHPDTSRRPLSPTDGSRQPSLLLRGAESFRDDSSTSYEV
mmetsp:Transcript_34132/g.77885  ORF Transcript_34132/g.77885 Transcript_34132/m.77885 type:complete len:1160 (+) Transcript_34132:132-3611(+)